MSAVDPEGAEAFTGAAAELPVLLSRPAVSLVFPHATKETRTIAAPAALKHRQGAVKRIGDIAPQEVGMSNSELAFTAGETGAGTVPSRP